MKIFTILSVILPAVLGTGDESDQTDYSQHGVNWEGLCADGKRQSPIPIVEENCSPVEDRIPFFHTNYDVPKTYDIYLDGDIYLSDLDFSENITMIGGGFLEYEYKFAQLHLHWGDDFRGGSEHTINGRRYFGEVHIVHYEDEYDNLGEALEDSKGDGVAVLGYFIDVRDDENESELDRIIQTAFKDYDFENNVGQISFSMFDLVRGNFENYFRYEGSLTTPECVEAVVWTIFKEPLVINTKTRDLILKTDSTKKVNNNFRTLMPVNDREVKYFHSDFGNSSKAKIPSLLLLSLLYFIIG